MALNLNLPSNWALARPNAALLPSGPWLGDQVFDNADLVDLSVTNPGNGAELTSIRALNHASAACLAPALDKAESAFQAWRYTSFRERSACLTRWAGLIEQERETLAAIITLEQGKPYQEALGEVTYGARYVQWFAEETKRIQGQILPSQGVEQLSMVLREPVGVCLAITPWNFPLAMITRKVAPAIAAGCSVLVKPAEQTPLTALALAELAKQAGLPSGVLTVLPATSQGSVLLGQALCADTRIRKLSFTGSTAVGRLLMAQSAPNLKRLSLELGGHAPMLIFPDADLDAAVAGTVAAKYRNAGQTCICVNRIVVHDDIADAFVARLSQASSALSMGPGWRAESQIGPLIDADAVQKSQLHVDDALAQGASLVSDVCKNDIAPIGKSTNQQGFFFAPTVLDHCTTAMRIAQEETFGPVAAVFRCQDEAGMLRLVNASEYGLAAYAFSRDIQRVTRVMRGLDYGMIGINTGILSNELAPFGGIKQSGFGREGGDAGIDEYLATKYVAIG